MPSYTIKRKNTSLADDMLLLETCLENIDCLAHLEKHCYKSVFWKAVSENVIKKSENFKTTRQIRDRFKRIYVYYTKIRNIPQFLSTLSTEQKEFWFFQKMHKCFTKVYYNENGTLSLISSNVKNTKKDEEWRNSLMEYPNNLELEEPTQGMELVLYMCEINKKGKYQTAAEMMHQFHLDKK